MMQRFSLGSFVSGVMFGALIVGGWFLGDSLPEIQLNPTPSLTPTTETSVQNSGTISVTNQSAGMNVTVESVTVPPPGVWVAVREMSGRSLGNVLGAARVVGPHTNITVSLLRATEPSRSYAVELYRDDNNGDFDPAVNSVYVDFDTGARAVSYFTTTE